MGAVSGRWRIVAEGVRLLCVVCQTDGGEVDDAPWCEVEAFDTWGEHRGVAVLEHGDDRLMRENRGLRLLVDAGAGGGERGHTREVGPERGANRVPRRSGRTGRLSCHPRTERNGTRTRVKTRLP